MSQNPVRALLNFALRVYDEELQRAGGADGGGSRPGLLEWGAAFQQRERELKDLYAAALREAERTGFPIAEVERRLRNLQTHILAILLWPRDAPPLTSEELRSRELSGCWSGGPVSNYLSEHTRRMMDAWWEVESLALRLERGPEGNPAIRALIDSDRAKTEEAQDRQREAQARAAALTRARAAAQALTEGPDPWAADHAVGWVKRLEDLFAALAEAGRLEVVAALPDRGKGRSLVKEVLATLGPDGQGKCSGTSAAAELLRAVPALGNLDRETRDDLIKDLPGDLLQLLGTDVPRQGAEGRVDASAAPPAQPDPHGAAAMSPGVSIFPAVAELVRVIRQTLNNPGCGPVGNPIPADKADGVQTIRLSTLLIAPGIEHAQLRDVPIPARPDAAPGASPGSAPLRGEGTPRGSCPGEAVESGCAAHTWGS
jgi:hypothetical protein